MLRSIQWCQCSAPERCMAEQPLWERVLGQSTSCHGSSDVLSICRVLCGSTTRCYCTEYIKPTHATLLRMY